MRWEDHARHLLEIAGVKPEEFAEFRVKYIADYLRDEIVKEGQVEVREQGGELDEVVSEGYFHLEQMGDNHWWMGIGERCRVHVNLVADGPIKATWFHNDGPAPKVVRDGEISREEEKRT